MKPPGDGQRPGLVVSMLRYAVRMLDALVIPHLCTPTSNTKRTPLPHEEKKAPPAHEGQARAHVTKRPLRS